MQQESKDCGGCADLDLKLRMLEAQVYTLQLALKEEQRLNRVLHDKYLKWKKKAIQK